MVQPVNYTSSFGNIGDTLTKGYSLGSKMREDIVKRKLIETQQARQNEANQGLIDLSNNLSADNAQKFMVRFPEYSEKLKGVFDGMQQTEKDEIKMEAAQTANLLENGTPEMAKAYLLEKEEAYRNKGDNQRADSYKKMAELAETHPNLIKTQAFNTVWQLGGKDAVESMIKLRKSDSEIEGLGLDNELKRENLLTEKVDRENKQIDTKTKKASFLQQMASLGKTEAETKKITQERIRIENEIKRMQDENGKIPLDKRPDAELKYTNQYLKEAGDFIKLERQYKDLMQSSPTGVGALNTILSFYKMKDPTSVVSSTEAANAKNAPGWTEKMRNIYNQAFEKGKLGEETLAQFRKEAKNIFENAKSSADKSAKRISETAKGYGLNVENIFNESVLERLSKPDPSDYTPEDLAKEFAD